LNGFQKELQNDDDPPMMTSPRYIAFFGGLRVQASPDGPAVVTRFRTQKTAALLAYLAVHGDRAHPREELIDLLWPDADGPSGRLSLRQALSSLRRQLEPPGVLMGAVLHADRANVRLEPRAFTTDVAEFEASLAKARGTESPSERVRHLEVALAQYTGPFLPGFYDDWIDARRQHLTQLHQQALRQIIGDLARGGDLPRALEHATRAVEADPRDDDLRELFRRLTTAAEKSGGGALSVPAITTDSLSVPEIIAAEVAPAAGSVPILLNRFFGRDSERATLARHFAAPGIRLTTLTGPGGTGKTRLALEAAADERRGDAWPGGVWFVPLADLRDANRLPDLVRDILLLPRDAPADSLTRVIEALNGRRALLILDNFEQIAAGGAPIVQTLLSRLPLLKCLTTSRERLAIPGEHLLDIGPLPLPDRSAATTAEIAGAAAVQLFTDRAQAARPDFQVTPRNAVAVSDLCVALEGIPLSIELAAALSQVLSPSQMLERLSARFDLLSTRRTDRDARHRSLWATISWSYVLLQPETQRFYARLSAFRGGWTEEAAAAVCDEPHALDLLAQLRERSLIVSRETSQGAIRFGMLETIREFGRAQLTDVESRALALSHAVYFRRLADEGDDQLQTPAAPLYLARFETEHDNFRAALETCLRIPDRLARETGLRLVGALYFFWYRQGYQREAAEHCAAALAAAEAEPDAGEPSLLSPRGRACNVAGLLATWRGDYADAEAFLQRSLACQRAAEYPRGVYSSLNNLGMVCRRIEDVGRAREYYGEALTVARAMDSAGAIAMTLNNLGNLANEGGDNHEAEVLYTEALMLQRERGDPYEVAVLTSNLANLLAAAGQTEKAASHYAEALQICEALDARPLLTRLFLNIGRMASRRGDSENAMRLLGAAEANELRLGQQMSPADQRSAGEFAATLEAALGCDSRERLRTAGTALALEDALRLAHSILVVPIVPKE
jgi:predicted ATPase/DNA-binding SARP family transcriptional activator/Tfp pilus assembly protein PilF